MRRPLRQPRLSDRNSNGAIVENSALDREVFSDAEIWKRAHDLNHGRSKIQAGVDTQPDGFFDFT